MWISDREIKTLDVQMKNSVICSPTNPVRFPKINKVRARTFIPTFASETCAANYKPPQKEKIVTRL